MWRAAVHGVTESDTNEQLNNIDDKEQRHRKMTDTKRYRVNWQITDTQDTEIHR